MRIRAEYCVGRELKFLSNLDMMRLVERAIRRAGIPYQLSAGFNPHIKMSMGTILPVGLWGTREYFDVDLADTMTGAEFAKRMNSCLPSQIFINFCNEIDEKAPALMKVINAAVYSYVLKPNIAVSDWPDLIMSQDSIQVMNKGKKRGIEKELRPGIYKVDYRNENDLPVIDIWAAVGEPVNVRFDELQDIIFNMGLETGDIIDIYRNGNYIKEGDEFFSPLEKVD